MDECFNDFRADIGKVQERLRERGRLIKELRSKVSSVATTPGPRYAPEDPTLPRPWRGLIDGSTGSLYYWNTATNQTQYERPCEQAWTTHPQYPPTLPSSECPVHSNTPPYNPDFPPLTHPTQPVYLHRKQLRGFRRRVSRTATQRLFKATRKPDVLWSVGTYSRSKVNRKHRLWVIKAQNDDVFSEIMEELCQLSMVPKAPVDTSQLTATNPSSLPLISKVLEQKEVLYSMAASALAGEIEKPRQALSVTDAEDGSWDDSAKVLLSTSDGSCSHSDLSYQIHSHTSDATNVEIAISNVIGLHKPEAVDIHGFISGEADACSNSSIVRQKTVAMRKKMKELISKPEFSLGVYEPRLVSYVSEVTKIPCQNIEFVLELLREARLHFDRFIKDLSTWNFKKSHLGLSHCYRIINATANGEFLIASGTPHILVDTLKAILLEFEKHLNFEISAGDYCYWKLSLPLSAWFENIQWSDEQVLGADDHFQNYELPKLLLTYLTSSNCFVVYTLLLHESLSGIPKSYHSVLALQLGFSLTWHIYSMATINLLLLLVRVVKWPNQNSSYVPVIDATHVLLQGAAIGFVLVVVPNMYHACSDNDFTRHLGIVIAYPQLNFEGEKSSKTMTEALEVVETPRNGQQFQVLAVFIIRQPITLLQWVYLRTLDNATLSNALCLAPTCTDSAQLLTHRVMIPMLLQLHSYLHELGLRTHMHELDYLFMTSWAYIVRTLPLSVTTMCMADITRGNPSLLAVVVFHFHCQCQPWGSFVDKVIASVNNISELSFLRVTESSTFYSPFYALVRKLLPLSPMAAIQLLGSLLANILRDDDHYIIGILVLNSIIQLVSLKPTQLGLAINYGAIWNGNYCSHESCSIYSPEFMDTWVIEFGCITINFGYLALIPSRHFSLPMRSMEALLLPLLLTIMHCQIRELGNSKYSANSTSQVSIHLCAIVHTWQVKDDGIASSAARTKIKDLKLIYSTLWGLPLFTGVMLNGVPRLGYLYLDYLVGLSYGDDVSMIDIIVAALCGKSIAFIEFHVKMQGVETTFLIWVLASSKHILASHIANQMVGFAELYEKSTDNELESWVVSTTNLVIDALTTHTTLPLVTMDIYVMYKTVMFHLLQAKSSKVHAFGTAVVPGAIYMRLNGTAYMVSGCCRDIAPNWLSKSQVVQFCNISDAWLLSSLLIKSSSTILLLVNLLILTFSSGNLDFQLEDEWVKTPQEKRCSSFLIYEESGIVGYVADLQEKQLHALIIGTSLVSNVGDGATPPARLLTDTVQASQAWLLAGKAFSLVTSLIPCALLISLTQVISTIAAAFAQFISAVYRHINDKTSTHIAAFKILSHPSPHYHLLDFCTGYGRRFSLGDKSVFEGVELLGPYLVTWAT